MSERISDTNNGTANSEARTPRFNRSKTVQVIISILVALALWVYVEGAGEDEDHPGCPGGVLRREHHVGRQKSDATVRI